jgi:hypothetical protein
MNIRYGLLSVVFSAWLLSGLAGSARAEVSSRECIVIPPNAQNQAWVVPANSTVTFLTHPFNVYDSSNAVFSGQIFFHDSTQPVGQRVRYDLLVDGSTSGRLTTPIQYYNRTPWTTAGTTSLRAFYTNLSPGNHTLTLSVINNSASALLIWGVYVNALFLDSSEAAVGILSTTTQTVTTSYSTIAQITIPSITNRHLFLSSYVRATAASPLTLRYLVNGTEVESESFDLHGTDGGALLDWLIQNAVAGQTVQLQAKTSSGTASVTVAELASQAMKTYSVLNLSANDTHTTSGTFGNPVTISTTPSIFLNSLSLSGPAALDVNQYATCMWGTADTSLSMPTSGETELILKLLENGTPFNFDLGVVGHSPEAVTSTFHQQSDLGCGAGFYSNRTYAAQQWLHDLCSGRTFTYGHRRLQLVVMPAPCPPGQTCPSWTSTLDNHTCTANAPGTTCPFLCSINSSLAVQTIQGPAWCN